MLGRRRLLQAGAAGALVAGGLVRGADAGDPAVEGRWSPIYPWPSVAIHLSLLPQSTPSRAVLLSFGTEEDAVTGRHLERTQSYLVAVARNGAPLTGPVLVTSDTTNLFCSGHAFLPDGRLIVAGGIVGETFYGSGDINVFEYGDTSRWVLQDTKLNAARWYATVTALPDGGMLFLSGIMAGAGQVNPLPQVWTAGAGGGIRNLTSALFALSSYPKAFVAPDGRVVCVAGGITTRYLDTRGAGSWAIGPRRLNGYQDYGLAVLLGDDRILCAGGAPGHSQAPIAAAEILDLAAATPTWRSTTPMSFARRHANATLLPDGTVLVTGGTSSAGFNDAAGAVYAAELFDPATERWTVLASARVPRVYHSTALLLPDGRVISAGGGQPAADNWGVDNTTAEFFSPPYLFRGPRPRVTYAPATAKLGGAVRITTPDGAGAAAVTLVRLGSVTHTVNMNQRFRRLDFTTTSTGLRATLPNDPNRLLPGHYLLFVLNGAGVPSVGRVIQITAA